MRILTWNERNFSCWFSYSLLTFWPYGDKGELSCLVYTKSPLSLPFGLHAIWTWSGSLLVPAEEREYICCLGLMPFGPCKGHLQYQLAWDNVSAIWTSCHLDLGKVIWCWRAYQLGWEVISLPGDQRMDWWARECLCHWGFMPFGPWRHHLCDCLVGPVGVRQDSKASFSPSLNFFLKLCPCFGFLFCLCFKKILRSLRVKTSHYVGK